MDNKPDIQEVFRSTWLGIKFISFERNGKTIKNYEMVFRPNKQDKNLEVQSVDIIPIIKYKDKPTQIILIANFRPPIFKYALEFPAGLMEDNNLEGNAIRELKEETGYIVESVIDFPTPIVYLDPWKGNQTSKMLLVTVDGDKNINPKQQLEYDEDIQVFRLKLDETLLNQILDLQKQKGFVLQSKVWAICLGLNMMKFV